MKTVGYGAFSRTLIGSVSLPENIEEIGSAAFASCSRLKKGEWDVPAISTGENLFLGSGGSQGFVLVLGDAVRLLPDNLLTNEGVGRLGGKGSKQLVWPEDSHIDSIGRSTFSGNTLLTEVKIPGSVRAIGDYAFWNCSGLRNVSLPAGVEYLGKSVFAACPTLTQVG